MYGNMSISHVDELSSAVFSQPSEEYYKKGNSHVKSKPFYYYRS